MQYPKYNLYNVGNYRYQFYSEGPNGIIRFLVKFENTETRNVFNLAFGVADNEDKLDDKIRTRNGDMEKILTTIFSAILDFTSESREAVLYFEGSSVTRTRLYRMAITSNWQLLSQDFYIWGLVEDGGNDFIEPFRKGKEYSGFFAKRNKFVS